jgi:PAS domain S-box-containing protein
MTLKLHVTRIHAWLAPVGIVLAAFSPALWFVAGSAEGSSHRTLLYAAAGISSLALLLLYLAVLILDLDSRRALRMVRRAVDRSRRGRFLVSRPQLAEEGQGSQTGTYSRWADTLGLLAELLQDYGSTLLSLLDGLSPGVVLLNRRSEVLTANLSFCGLFNLNRDAVAGKALQDLLPADLALRWSARAVEVSHWFGDDVAEVMDSSSGRLFRTSVTQIRPGKGEEGLLALFLEDLTERSAPRSDADEFRQLYERILESISEAILLVGPEGSVEDVNPAAAALLGYERAQVLGMKLAQLLVPGSEEDAACRLDSYVLSGDYRLHGRRLDALFLRADGSVFCGEARLREWEHGGRRLVLISLRDTTGEQQADLLTRERLQVVEMLSRHQPLDEVLARLAEMVDHQIPEAACAVMLRRGDRLFAIASPNLPPSFAQCLWDLPMEDSGASCAAAASGGTLSTVPDIAASAMREDLRQAALPQGLRASWSAPVVSSEGLVTGTVGVYRRQPGEPSGEQRELLQWPPGWLPSASSNGN